MPGRLLICDDDEGMRKGLSSVLVRSGYEVRCAENGAVALDLLAGGFLPDVILLDVAMPVMDGPALAAELKKTPFARVPIIVLSAVGTRIEGATMHLRKPFDILGLLEEVERLCKRPG